MPQAFVFEICQGFSRFVLIEETFEGLSQQCEKCLNQTSGKSIRPLIWAVKAADSDSNDVSGGSHQRNIKVFSLAQRCGGTSCRAMVIDGQLHEGGIGIRQGMVHANEPIGRVRLPNFKRNIQPRRHDFMSLSIERLAIHEAGKGTGGFVKQAHLSLAFT